MCIRDSTWTNNASNATGLVISDNLTSVTLGAGTTSYTWSGLAPSTYKCSHVYAYNSAGNSAWSGWACTTTPAAVTIPAAPSNITATAINSSTIQVTWTNNASNATGLVISDNLTIVLLDTGTT